MGEGRNLLSFLRGLEQLPEIRGAGVAEQRVDIVLRAGG